MFARGMNNSGDNLVMRRLAEKRADLPQCRVGRIAQRFRTDEQALFAGEVGEQAGDMPAPGPTFEAELTRGFAALDGILALEE